MIKLKKLIIVVVALAISAIIAFLVFRNIELKSENEDYILEINKLKTINLELTNEYDEKLKLNENRISDYSYELSIANDVINGQTKEIEGIESELEELTANKLEQELKLADVLRITMGYVSYMDEYISIGMYEDEINSMIGDPLEVSSYIQDSDETPFGRGTEFKTMTYQDFELWFIRGELYEITLLSNNISTVLGLTIGDSSETFFSLYRTNLLSRYDIGSVDDLSGRFELDGGLYYDEILIVTIDGDIVTNIEIEQFIP